jgi:hypothetical protein
MHSVVHSKIAYGVWRSNVDVDRTAKCKDSLFRFPFTPNLNYAADNLLLVDSLSGGIVIPAKNPHIGAAFPLCSKEAPSLKPVHFISFAYTYSCLIGATGCNAILRYARISPLIHIRPICGHKREWMSALAELATVEPRVTCPRWRRPCKSLSREKHELPGRALESAHLTSDRLQRQAFTSCPACCAGDGAKPC